MKYLYRALLASFIILSSTTLAYAQTVVLAPVTTNTTWTAANGPFLIGIPVTIQSGATLTIEPGTIVKFTEQSAGLEIETGATLSAQGTGDLPIYFTSHSDDVGGDTNGDGNATTPTNRQWGRIVNFGTLNLANTHVRYGGYIAGGLSLRSGSVTSLTSATIHDMGSDGISLSGGTLTATRSTISNNGKGLDQSGGSATFTSSTFSNNTQGFEVQGASTTTLTNNTFTNNTLTGSFVNPHTFSHAGNTITGGEMRAFMLTGSLNHALALGSDVPYVINGVFAITANGTLTAPAGAVVKFRDTTSGISIQSGGALIAQGTEENKVYFTDIDSPEGGDTDGDGDTTPASRAWGKIQNAGALSLLHTVVSYGGFVSGGLTFTAGSTNTLDYVTIQSMGSDGISQQGGVTEITHSIIRSHGKNIEISGGTLSINFSAITDGLFFGVDNSSLGIVDATNNWWGHESGPQHPTNIGALGNPVSDRVSYVPFMTSELQLNEAKTYAVAVILAEPYDVSHVSTPITAQPCKLIPEKTYPNGHDKVYYTDLLHCVTDYYKEVSKGTVNLEFTIFDNNGMWYKITDPQKTEGWYATKSPSTNEDRGHIFVSDIINLVGPQVLENYTFLSVVHSGYSDQMISGGIKSVAWPVHLRPNIFVSRPQTLLASRDDIGIFAHEYGHILGVLLTPQQTLLPDLGGSAQEGLGKWDLMAYGALNEGGRNPALFSSFSRIVLGWLTEQSLPEGMNTHVIPPLEKKPYKGYIEKYNIKPGTHYYLIENRNKSFSVWDTSIPVSDSAIVLYEVLKPKNESGYGYVSPMSSETFMSRWSVQIPSVGTAHGGILDQENDRYLDPANLISFTRLTKNPDDSINISIQPLTQNMFLSKMTGFVLSLKRFPFEDVQGGANAPSLQDTTIVSKAEYTNTLTFFFACLFVVAVSLFALTLLLKRKKRFHIIVYFVLSVLLVSVLCTLYFAFDYNKKFNDFIESQGCYVNGQKIYKWGFFKETKKNCRGVYAPSDSEIQPDLDLHAITPDGRHIGVNYQTGEYENQIAGSIVSGDNQGIHEWIFVPEGETVRYYVSARDNQAFLAENPQITDTTDTFDIYARTIDPASGIFTSETLTNQTIAPTEERVYEVGAISAEVPMVIPTNALIVTADNQRIPLGSDIPTLTYTLSGFSGEDTAETSTAGSALCTTTATNTSPVGTYPITCTRGDFASEDYAIASYTSGTLTIAPTLTVTGDDLTIPEGSDIPTLTATIGGFLGTDTAESTTTGTPDCVTTATNTSPIGTYPITCTVGTLSSSTYIITTYAEGVLTILPRLTVTADDKTMTEGQAVPPLTTTITGFLGSDTRESSTAGTPACSTTAGPSSAPGAYPIICTVGTLESNTYALTTFVDGTLTVEPAIIIRPLTVTAHDKTMVQGKPLPALTYTLSGFTNGDTAASSTTGSASCTTTATTTSPVGIYPITCTEGSLASTTYTFSDFVPATLTITDGTPPELQTVFSMTLKDVVLSAVDSVDEQPTFAHTGNTITLTDAAGNITTINLTKYKESATKLKLTFNSITRNGVTTSVPNTTIMYDWSLSANNQLKDLDSRVTIHGVERYIFNYKRLKDETKIKVKTGNSHTTTTRDGFVSPTVTTEGGGVLVTY